MAIVEIKKFSRTNTSVKFWIDATRTITEAALIAFKAAVQPYKESGKATWTTTLSNDGLQQTHTVTYADLATYSAVDTAATVALDASFIGYAAANNVEYLALGFDQYTQSGIDQPFTCTTVYTFNNDTIRDTIVSKMTEFGTLNETTDKQTVTVTTNQITQIVQYENSDHFTENCWKDIELVPAMQAAGVTRTISYAFV